MEKMMVIGLGNIGEAYQHTRHNIGFDVVDAFAKKHAISFQQVHLALRANLLYRGRTLVLIKPTTYMNLSGSAFVYWQQKEQIKTENCLVVVDDLAISLNALKLKTQGSDGGHNGLKHIALLLQTKQYPRLRFGIGNDFKKSKQVDFVLGKWAADEINIVTQKIEYCCEVIEKFCVTPLQYLMNEVNAKSFQNV